MLRASSGHFAIDDKGLIVHALVNVTKISKYIHHTFDVKCTDRMLRVVDTNLDIS